ncbi:MAG TPA: DUF1559 domain-containing protein, partial [Planctomycetaceae bacterium]|nr:DUF1559 domain-containing protein [Planctomycetaceae bacterium]
MQARRSGFTVVELVVATAIGALLMAVMLPAVMNSREISRRSQCLNNLKQISLANLNYNDIHGRFVPAYVATFNANCPEVCFCGQISTYNNFNLHTWGSLLLPFLEAQTLYDRIDVKSPLFS